MPLRSVLFAMIFLSYSSAGLAEESAACLETAMSQHEMNQCAGIGVQEAEAELNRVVSEIRGHYKDQPEFLTKLESSQQAWIVLKDANMEMKYPLGDKQYNYGSVYPMCASGYATQLTLSRIEFLKTWLVGHGDGEVCSGSVIHSYCLENDCSKIRS